MHKLSSTWEGPFIVTEVINPSTYRLQWCDGQGVPNRLCSIQMTMGASSIQMKNNSHFSF
jgi:hypothetical protein